MQPPVTPPPILAPAALPYAIPPQYDAPPGWTNIQVFHLSPAKRTPFLLGLGTVHLIASLAMPLGFAIAEKIFLPDLSLLALIIVGMIVFMAMNVVGLIIILREFQTWPTYRLLLADQGFIRFHRRAPTVHALAADIDRIVEQFDGFRIFFRNGTTTHLSTRIDNPDVLRQRLARWTPVTKGASLLRLAATIASDLSLYLGNGICFLIGFNTDNPESMLYAEFLGTLFAAAILRRSFRKKVISRSDRICSFFFVALPLALAIRILRWFHNPPA